MTNAIENLKKIYNVDAASQALSQITDHETVQAVKDALGKNTELASKLVATNSNAASDVIALQTAEARKSVEGLLNQVNVLANTADFDSVVRAQRAYVEQATEALSELTWKNVDIITDALEASVSLVKDATAKPATKKAVTVKTVAKKAAAKKAATQAA